MRVDGTAKAGTAVADVNITIDGQAIPAGYTTTSTLTPLTITKSNSDIEVTTGTVDYGNELSNRLETINALIGDYTMGSLSNEALSGYVMERERILNKLDELGLLEYATESDGSQVPVPIMGSMFVVSTEIGDIEASGGDVVINAGSLKGTGTIEAKGAPNVTIENTSNTWLRLHEIDVGSSGGNVKFNGYSVMSGDESVPTEMTIKNAALNGDGDIKIENKPNLSKLNLRGTGNYIPVGDVDILGVISTENGDVSISNTGGDIDIYSTGGVNGRNVTITTSGTLSQGYTPGIVNIAGDPARMLSVTATTMENAARRALDTKTDSKNSTTNTSATMDTGANGRIAGKNIYLAADYINVNGLIQAGYDSYIAEVNESDLDADALQKEAEQILGARTVEGMTGWFVRNDGEVGKYYIYGRSNADDESTLFDGPGADLDDMSQVEVDAYAKRLQGATSYAVGSKVGASYNSDKGYYDWYVPITLNRSTNRLTMADIDTSGGTVYLSGRLLSTGNGRIYAANGLADIDIRNNTSLPLYAGRVINNNREGRIVLADTGRDVLTEYRSGQTRTVTNYSDALQRNPLNVFASAVTTTNNLTDGATTTYTPGDFTYNWTDGTTTKTRYSYEASVERWQAGVVVDALTGVGLALRFAGLKDPKPNESEARILSSYENSQNASPKDLGNLGLKSGTYINEGTAADGLTLTTENKVTDQPSRGGYTVKTERDNYWVVEKVKVTANWYKDVGSLQAYTFTVPANKAITLGFMSGASGDVNLKSGGDLYLTDDIELSSGEFRAESTGGSIRQDENAYITAASVGLSAAKDINGLKMRALDYDFTATEADYGKGVANAYRGLKLSAASTNGGKLNLTVEGNTLSNGHVTPGDVLLEELSTSGKAALTTEGSILSKSGNISGRTVKLTSNSGGIYLNGFTTDGLTASAVGDINLTNERINVSKLRTSGTVRLKVKELYSNGQEVEAEDLREEHIHAWIDAGLIAPIEGYKGTYVTNLERDALAYEANVDAEYEAYSEIDQEEYNQKLATISEEYDKYKEVDRESYEAQVAALNEEFDEYTLTATRVSEIVSDYDTYISMKGTDQEGAPEYWDLSERFDGYGDAFEYIRTNAEELGIDADLAEKFYGYDSAAGYLAVNDEAGRLLAKYEGYDSASEYVDANVTESALMNKYGSYSSKEAYLAADEKYQVIARRLSTAYDPSSYPTTLEALMDADEQDITGLNVAAKALYVNNVKYKSVSDVETAN